MPIEAPVTAAISAPDVYLVTGAFGCIGAWTVRLLAQHGATVVTFDRSLDKTRLELLLTPAELLAVTHVSGDVTDLEGLLRVIDEHQVTHVVHLAALQVPFCRADPIRGALVNVVGTAAIFEAVKRRARSIRGLVYMSSVALFDARDAEPTGTVREDAAAHPTTHYGVYKQANEGTARVYWQDDRVRSVGLRPYVVYGVGRDQGLTSSPTKAMAAAAIGRPYELTYSGHSVLQYAEDVAAAVVKACQSRLDGAPVFNLPGASVDMQEIVSTIEHVAPGSTATFRSGGDAIPFPRSVEADTIAEALGPLPATSLEAGVRATIEMFRALHREGRLPASAYGP